MKQSIRLILGGAIFCLPMLFTSCGNIDNPLEELVASSVPMPETPAKTYRVYTSGTAYTDEAFPDGAILVESSAAAVTWSEGTYVVEDDVTITGGIILEGDVNLILCDGAELTVNGTIDGHANSKSLNIYGQAESTGKLTIDGDAGSYNIVVDDLQIHGGDITGTNSDQAIETYAPFKVYHGNVDVTANVNGFMVMGDLLIYGGTITASSTTGPAVSVNPSSMSATDGSLTMTGGSLTATNGTAAEGIFVDKIIDISGGTVIATGGDDISGSGGSGIVSNNGDITISGTAIVTATGMYGIITNTIEIDGSSTIVNSTGYQNGIKAATSITFKAGTVTCESTRANSVAILSPTIDYQGGAIEATGGPSGHFITGKLTNNSGGTVSLEMKNDGGTSWLIGSMGINTAIIFGDASPRYIKNNMQ